MDSVKDYAEYMKEIFDFDAIKKLITGADGKKPFNVLFNAMHGGMYVIISRISKVMIILFILYVVNAITARQRICGKVMFSVTSVCSHHGPYPYPSVYRALVLIVQTCSARTSLNRAHPWICSNLFVIKHVRLASGRLASYWNVFLFIR